LALKTAALKKKKKKKAKITVMAIARKEERVFWPFH